MKVNKKGPDRAQYDCLKMVALVNILDAAFGDLGYQV